MGHNFYLYPCKKLVSEHIQNVRRKSYAATKIIGPYKASTLHSISIVKRARIVKGVFCYIQLMYSREIHNRDLYNRMQSNTLSDLATQQSKNLFNFWATRPVFFAFSSQTTGKKIGQRNQKQKSKSGDIVKEDFKIE